MHGRAHQVLERVRKAGDGESCEGAEPARSSSDRHAHVRTCVQRRQRAIVDDLEQCTSIHCRMRKDRRAVEQVSPMDVRRVRGRRAPEMRQCIVEASCKQDGGDRCPRARRRDACGGKIDRFANSPIEARLPDAAVATAGKYHAVKHWRGRQTVRAAGIPRQWP